MSRHVLLLLVAFTLGVAATVAHAKDPIARVHGAGKAVLTDPDENPFADNIFTVTAQVDADGSAKGNVHFVLAEAFSEVWGAVPGVDFIHLKARIIAGEVAEDGSVLLSGLVTEVDYANGEGVVFVEEDVPLELVVDADGEQFMLQWCLLPVFDLQVSHGELKVK